MAELTCANGTGSAVSCYGRRSHGHSAAKVAEAASKATAAATTTTTVAALATGAAAKAK